MTLVELLVVVTILLILAVTVLPSIAGSAESRRSRETARSVSSFIARAQSRSIGRQQWAGFMFLATGAGLGAVDLLTVDVPEAYRGDSATASVSIACGGNTGTASAVTAGDLSSIGTVNTGTNDLIRFDSRGPTFEITSGSSLPIVFRPRGNTSGTTSGGTGGEDIGQSTLNTPWPSPSPATHTFEIFRQPVPAGPPFTLPEGRVIDITWSGYGPNNATYRNFSSGSTVGVLFDGTGRMRQLIVNSIRQTAIGPVFLLVGRADRAGQSDQSPLADDSKGANWQYADSTWIAIDPFTGVVKSAECTPLATSPTPTVVDSQAWIRQALLGSSL